MSIGTLGVAVGCRAINSGQTGYMLQLEAFEHQEQPMSFMLHSLARRQN